MSIDSRYSSISDSSGEGPHLIPMYLIMPVASIQPIQFLKWGRVMTLPGYT